MLGGVDAGWGAFWVGWNLKGWSLVVGFWVGGADWVESGWSGV